MAGDKLADPNYAARLKLSEDPETAAERAGLVGDNYDVSGYSDKEISMALQGDEFGANDYARLTGKSMGGDDDNGSGGGGEDPSDPKPEQPKPPVGGPFFPPGGGGDDVFIPPIFGAPGDSTMTQNVSQDNDVNQTIGDGSTVTNKIDNSVSQQSGGYGFLGNYMKKYDFFK